jgi:hypothetical protein
MVPGRTALEPKDRRQHILRFDSMSRSKLPHAEDLLHRAAKPAKQVDLVNGLIDQGSATFGTPTALTGRE